MTEDDRRLMMEISAQADIAYQSRPKRTNSMALAEALEASFHIEKSTISIIRSGMSGG